MDQSFNSQKGLLTSEDVAKSPPGTNLPMAVKYSPDGKLRVLLLLLFPAAANQSPTASELPSCSSCIVKSNRPATDYIVSDRITFSN